MIVGAHTYMSDDAVLREYEGIISIGDYCSIGDGLRIIGGAEHHPERVSTWAFAERMGVGPPTSDSKGPVIIGSDVWIGSHVIILSGVTIGHGAVIGAGSVVTRSVPPYAIAAGNPARVIRYRFDEVTIARLLDIEWWEWPEDKVRDHAALLTSDPQAFIEEVG